MNALRNAAMIALFAAGFMFFMSGCGKDEHAGHDHGATTAPQEVQEETAQVEQKKCPVMGLAIDKNIYVDHEGTRVYFCCPACVETFKANPEKYMEVYREQLGQAPKAGSAHEHHAH